MVTQRSRTLTLHTRHTIAQTHHKECQNIVQKIESKCMKSQMKTQTKWRVVINKSLALSLLKALSILDLTKRPILLEVHGLKGPNPIWYTSNNR